MYNDTIKVANKIILDSDLLDVFHKMIEEDKKLYEIYNKEKEENEKFEYNYQKWTTKDLTRHFKCIFNFHDDTQVSIDNYDDLLSLFNNRLAEIKNMWIEYGFSYTIQNEGETKFIKQYIDLDIYENKMSISVDLSSEDNRLNDVYELIKSKILNAPNKYNKMIKNRKMIINKICFAKGLIPSIAICTLLAFVQSIREVYVMTYVLYPVAVIVFGFLIGNVLFSKSLYKLYSNIVPKQKYAGYNEKTLKNIYKDDTEEFLNTSEIIIGKNIHNVENRLEIIKTIKKYKKYIPRELLITAVIDLLIILISKM